MLRHKQLVEDEALASHMEAVSALRTEPTKSLGTVQMPKEEDNTDASYGVIPYPPNSRFRGRGDILAAIHDCLAGKQVARSTQRSVALYGMGGVGKTQIALRYVYDYQASYKAVFWVSADSPSKLFQDFTKIAKTLNLNAGNLSDQNEIVREVQRWFRQTTDQWLLVFDNADDLRLLQKFWPTARKGFILATSRDRFAGKSPASHGIPVKPMSLADSTMVFFSLLDRPMIVHPLEGSDDAINLDTATKLVKELGNLPLAISQAAGYMLRAQCSIVYYFEMYTELGNDLSLLENQKDVEYFYDRTIANTWDISLRQIETHEPHAAELLRILSFFDPDGIPESLLTEGSAAFEGDVQLAFLKHKVKYNDAIGALVQLSLIDRENNTITMHRMIQKATLHRMKPDIFLATFQMATTLAWKVFPSSDTYTLWPHWPEAQKYLPHVLKLQQNYELLGTNPTSEHLASLFTECGKYLKERALFDQSIRVVTLAKTIWEEIYGLESLPTADCHYGLGHAFLEQMRLSEAIESFKVAGKIREKKLGKRNRATADAYNE